MQRRTFLAAAASPALLRSQSPSTPPNIIFILADDMGWGDLSCYGNTQMKTPNLDRLASEGTLFTQFYVNGSVCSPSRSAFLTGLFPARNQIHGHFATEELNQRRAMPNFLDPARPTLARRLKQAGYRTSHVGKWHLGRWQGAPLPDAYGFDFHHSVSSNDSRYEEMAPGFRAKSTAWIVDQTIDFIKAGSGPFYSQMWLLLPHAPLAPTDAQLAPFQNLQPGPHVPWPGARQIYNASLRDVDDQLGPFLAFLEKENLAQNTLLVFSSDNGPEDIHIGNASHAAFGSPGPFRGRKRSLYEGGIRVPGIVRWPGQVPVKTVNNSSALAAVDLFPTAAKLTGAQAPANLDGEDMSDVLRGSSRPRRRPLFWEWRYNVYGYAYNRSPILAMREGEHKLLFNPDRSRVELYNIPQDPMELNNLATAEKKRTDKMVSQALAWQKTLPPGPFDATAGKNSWSWPSP
ncbi:MAG: sulfatase-like hydrolase/transferase [Bryobacter sp.]|nr:sulfatase-like hydrolase/transferase [Bryobacter sp.]